MLQLARPVPLSPLLLVLLELPRQHSRLTCLVGHHDDLTEAMCAGVVIHPFKDVVQADRMRVEGFR